MTYRSVSVTPTDRWLVGLSTDIKPIPEASLATHHLLESDTGAIFFWSASKWIKTHADGKPVDWENPYGQTEEYNAGINKTSMPAGEHILFSLATPASPEAVIFKQLSLQSASGETEVLLYEDVSTALGGTMIVPLNRDRQSINTFPGIYTEFVDSHVGGTLVFSGVLLGSLQGGTFADGTRLINMRLKPSNLYVLHVHNLDGQAKGVAVEFVMGAIQ